MAHDDRPVCRDVGGPGLHAARQMLQVGDVAGGRPTEGVRVGHEGVVPSASHDDGTIRRNGVRARAHGARRCRIIRGPAHSPGAWRVLNEAIQTQQDRAGAHDDGAVGRDAVRVDAILSTGSHTHTRGPSERAGDIGLQAISPRETGVAYDDRSIGRNRGGPAAGGPGQKVQPDHPFRLGPAEGLVELGRRREIKINARLNRCFLVDAASDDDAPVGRDGGRPAAETTAGQVAQAAKTQRGRAGGSHHDHQQGCPQNRRPCGSRRELSHHWPPMDWTLYTTAPHDTTSARLVKPVRPRTWSPFGMTMPPAAFESPFSPLRGGSPDPPRAQASRAGPRTTVHGTCQPRAGRA